MTVSIHKDQPPKRRSRSDLAEWWVATAFVAAIIALTVWGVTVAVSYIFCYATSADNTNPELFHMMWPPFLPITGTTFVIALACYAITEFDS